MKTYDIAVIGGDGTGPEVDARRRSRSPRPPRKIRFKLNWHPYDFGGERYLKTGEVLPDSAVDELRKFKAIFLGAVGHPQVKPGILEKGILLRLRFRAGAIHQSPPGETLPRAGLPAQGQGAGAH